MQRVDDPLLRHRAFDLLHQLPVPSPPLLHGDIDIPRNTLHTPYARTAGASYPSSVTVPGTRAPGARRPLGKQMLERSSFPENGIFLTLRGQALEDCVPAADFTRARGLDVECCDLTILDEHRIAFGAHPQASIAQILVQAKRPCEFAEAV